jgi:hypothetical protein
MLTPEQIADRADRYNGRANIAAINRLFRRQDGPQLTDRAIRRLRREGYYFCGGLEYAYALDSEISRIVNSDIG